jgi:hypothetical protein
VEDFKEFLDAEMPHVVDFHPQAFIFICRILVFKMQLVKCWTRDEEAAYLAMLKNYDFSGSLEIPS